MIFVAVGQHNTAQLILAGGDIGEVGDHGVNAQDLLFGEHDSGVYQQILILMAEQRSVLADLTHAAQWDDLE